MRKLLSLFMTLCVCVGVFAYDAKIDGIYYNLYNYSDGARATVTYRDQNYNSYSGEVVVPSVIWYNGNEFTVTEIGEYAFCNCQSLSSITIPEGITLIGSHAFDNSYNVSSITLPQSITSIGDYAFYYCSAIQSIIIPSKITRIENCCFYGCQNLQSIIIPEGVTEIGYDAFGYCYQLSSISIPTTVTRIENGAFMNCHNVASIVVGSGNTVYDSRNDCNAIIETATNTLIRGCENTIIPKDIKIIGNGAFSSCQNLYTVDIPDAVDSIGDYAFSGISPLIVLCNRTNPMRIGRGIFSGENTYIVVPDAKKYKKAWTEYEEHIISRAEFDTVVTIVANQEGSALHQTLGLDKLRRTIKLKINGTINSYDIMMIRNQMPKLLELDLSDASIVANSYEYTKGYCSKNDTLTPYSFTGTGTQLHKVILPKTLKYIAPNAFNYHLRDLTISSGTIASRAFYGCYNIRKISMENGVTSIGSAAFCNCSSITSLTIPDLITEISDSAFFSCTSLQSIALGSSVTCINNRVFSQCTALHSVILNEKLTHIGTEAFCQCSSLHSVLLPQSLVAIGNGAFQGTGLTDIVIPANVESIGYKAFAGLNAQPSSYWGPCYYSIKNESMLSSSYHEGTGQIRSLFIPKKSKLTSIAPYAFADNNKLKKISILGDSIKSIQEGAFCKCQLDTLILPPNLKELNTLSFGYCDSLKFIAMPNSLTEISDNAFVGCTNLDNVQFPKKLTKIGHHAFADCTNLRNVDIPGLVTDIEEYAFKDCQVKSVYSYLFDPFTIGQNTFSPYANANAILYVPNVEDTEMKYLYDTQWSQFLNRQRMDKSFVYDDFYSKGDVNIRCEDDPLHGNPNATLYPGAGLTVEDNDCDTTDLGNIIIGSDGDDAWGAVLAGCNLHLDSLIQNITIQGKKWYFFGFPFDVKIEDIRTGAKYVIYEYDGQMRAERDTTGWKRLPKDQKYLHPGHGYIFQFNFAASGEISIVVPSPRFCDMLEKIILKFFPSDKANNKSWNYASNPFLGYYDINDLNITTPITIWDVAQGNYRTVRPGDDDYYFSPYEGFFLQNVEERDFELTFDRSKAMTKKQMDEQRDTRRHAMARTQQRHSGRAIINLTLASESASDDTRIVINEGAGMGYELGLDAAKFLSTENSVPQIFSYDDSNVQYAINERPMQTGVVELGVRIPASGMYTIDATRMDTMMYLLDRKMNIMHDFSTGAYMFSAGAGMQNNRFALVRQYNAPTDAEETIENTQVDVNADGLYIHGTADIQVYNMAGVCVADGTYSGAVALPAGVYMVVADGNTMKCVVR